MKGVLRKLSILFSAGCLGGLANSVALWMLGASGINAALGIKLAPALTPQWLYPRLVWGGIWGALFVLPLFGRSVFIRGVLFSLGPTFVQLFIVFPLRLNKGSMGLDLGTLTPLLVFFVNAIWGVCAAWWIRATKD